MSEKDYNNFDDKTIYELFNVKGNEEEALNDVYFEFLELVGRDMMFKIFNYYRGSRIEFPMHLYRSEFIIKLAKKETDKNKRAKIIRAGGYSARVIEKLLNQLKKQGGTT
jgi:hypothetical protein